MKCGAVSELGGEVCVEEAGHRGGHISATDEYGSCVSWGGPVMRNPVESPCPCEGCNVTSYHEADEPGGLIHNEDGSHTLVSV